MLGLPIPPIKPFSQNLAPTSFSRNGRSNIGKRDSCEQWEWLAAGCPADLLERHTMGWFYSPIYHGKDTVAVI